MYRLINSVFGLTNKKSQVLLLTPSRRSFGECANEMYYGLLKAQRESKKVLFIYPRPFIFKRLGFSVVNRELFDLDSEYNLPSKGFFGFIAGCLLSVYVFCLHILYELRYSNWSRQVFKHIWPVMKLEMGFSFPTIGRPELWKPYGINFFSWDILEMQHWSKQHEEYIPPRLKESKRRYAEQTRVQLGIPLTDWFVCLHARATESKPARNVSIHNYIEGIKAITNAGGWIVRLGDSAMTPLPTMEKVIDYAHSPYKSELMDLYLISQCRFFLGHSSGPNIIANLLRKPLLLVNMTEWSASTLLKKGDIGIIKHVFSRSQNRFLGIKEILEEPSMVQHDGVSAEDYELVENSPQEIREAIEEFLTRPDPYEYSDFQKTYNETRMKELRRCLEQGQPRQVLAVAEKDLFMERYRIGADVYAHGTLSETYLKKNWLRDEKERSPSPTDEGTVGGISDA